MAFSYFHCFFILPLLLLFNPASQNEANPDSATLHQSASSGADAGL